MKLKLHQVGEPVLRQIARELTPEEIRTPQVQQLIEFMRETMRDAPGVGLAAPQVGEPFQLAVIEDRAEYATHSPETVSAERERQPVPFHVIINPRMTISDSTLVNHREGCLSLIGFQAIVPRALAVRIACLNEYGEPVNIDARGWYARILQHEIDHLNGTLYIDRMDTRSFMTVQNHTRYWQNLPTTDDSNPSGSIKSRYPNSAQEKIEHHVTGL